MRDAFNKTDYSHWKATISCYKERTVFHTRAAKPLPVQFKTSLNPKKTEVTFWPVLRDCISNYANFLISCINHSDTVKSPEGNDHVIKSQWNWQ